MTVVGSNSKVPGDGGRGLKFWLGVVIQTDLGFYEAVGAERLTWASGGRGRPRGVGAVQTWRVLAFGLAVTRWWGSGALFKFYRWGSRRFLLSKKGMGISMYITWQIQYKGVVVNWWKGRKRWGGWMNGSTWRKWLYWSTMGWAVLSGRWFSDNGLRDLANGQGSCLKKTEVGLRVKG